MSASSTATSSTFAIPSKGVTTVCLPSTPSSPAKAVVAGWGQTTRNKGGVAERKLQFAYLDTYSVEECQAKYDKLLAGRATVLISPAMLCAGNKKADSCSGKDGWSCDCDMGYLLPSSQGTVEAQC